MFTDVKDVNDDSTIRYDASFFESLNRVVQSEASARDHFIYYAESHLQAVRWQNWKLHFAKRDGYYGATTKLEIRGSSTCGRTRSNRTTAP